MKTRSPSARTRVCAMGLGVLTLAACGASEPDVATDRQPTTSQTAELEPDFPCAADRSDCTSQEVVATMEELYVIGGATRAEATCLAPITAEGTSAVSQATEAPTEAETRAAIECVGSEARLREIAEGLAEYFESLPIEARTGSSTAETTTTDCSQTVDTTQVSVVVIVEDIPAGTTAEAAATSGALIETEGDWGLRPAYAFQSVQEMAGGVAVTDLPANQIALTRQWGLPEVTLPASPRPLCPR